MKRHSVWRVAGAATAAVLFAGGLSSCSAGGEGDGEQETLRVTLANHVWTDIITEDISEFEEETGIDVEVTQLSEDQLVDQYKVKLNAGTDEIDVMMYRPLQVGKQFAEFDYFADLTDKVAEAGDWDWSDFQEGPVSLTTYQDKVVGVPIITEVEVLYYRKDLLEAAGLEVPQTMKELEAAAKVIDEQYPDTAGFVARTGRSAAVTQFSGYLYSFGGEWTDGEGNSTIASDEAIEAYEYYGSLLRNYGPDQLSTDMSWPEAMAIFTAGNAAFYTDASSLYKNATDPENSKVADTVGFAPLPAGPDGSQPYNVAAWALGINANSPNSENAWEFIKWATSKDKMLQVQQEGVPGARTSVWEDPEGTSSFPDDLAKAVAVSGKTGVGHDRPVVISVAEAREAVGGPIVVAIQGGDVATAAKESDAAFQEILDSENK